MFKSLRERNLPLGYTKNKKETIFFYLVFLCHSTTLNVHKLLPNIHSNGTDSEKFSSKKKI